MKPELDKIARKFALELCKDSYGEKTMEGTLPYFQQAFAEAVMVLGLDYVQNDARHPFCQETLAQAEALKAIARREPITCDPTRLALEAAARKLEYLAQSFTCTANLAALELELQRARQCLAFFSSVIKSGEPWTEACRREYNMAMKLEYTAAEKTCQNCGYYFADNNWCGRHKNHPAAPCADFKHRNPE